MKMAAAPEDAWPPTKERQQNKENRATYDCLTLFLTVDYWYVGTNITLVPYCSGGRTGKSPRGGTPRFVH